MLACVKAQLEVPVRAAAAGSMGASVRPSALVRVLFRRCAGVCATS
jgi:hypothetical protein